MHTRTACFVLLAVMLGACSLSHTAEGDENPPVGDPAVDDPIIDLEVAIWPCALSESGVVRCWAALSGNCLPDELCEHTRVLDVRAPGGVQLAAGTLDVCVLQMNGQVSCWTDGSSERTILENVDHAVEVDIGGFGGCVRESDGRVGCWDRGPRGEGEVRPRQVRGLPAATSVSVGWGFACALDETQSVYCWSLGEWETFAEAEPTVHREGVVKIAAGASAAYVELVGGEVECFGGGSDPLTRAGPELASRSLGELGPLIDLDAGYDGACARTLDGSLYCIGAGFYGQVTGIPEGERLETLGLVDLGTAGAPFAIGHIARCAAEGREIACTGYGQTRFTFDL